jgi:hypothetical protein
VIVVVLVITGTDIGVVQYGVVVVDGGVVIVVVVVVVVLVDVVVVAVAVAVVVVVVDPQCSPDLFRRCWSL